MALWIYSIMNLRRFTINGDSMHDGGQRVQFYTAIILLIKVYIALYCVVHTIFPRLEVLIQIKPK